MKITPQKQKGSLSLYSQGGLVHVRWTDRSNNNVDEEYIVFPEEVTLKKINTGKEGDRVLLLKWNNGNRRLMYWLQDKNADKDAENVTKFNDFVKNPNHAASPAPGSAAGIAGGEQWMQMLGLGPQGAAAAGGSSSGAAPTAGVSGAALPGTSAAAAPPRPPPGAPSFDLSALLANSGIAPNPAPTATPGMFNLPPVPGSAGGGLTVEDMQRAMQAGASRQPPSNLADIVTSDAILNSGVLEDPEVRAQLIALLPEGQQSDEFLESNIRSGQLRQSLGALSSALNSDNYNSVVANIGQGMDPNDGMQHLLQGDGVQAFLSSLQAANSSDASTNPTSSAGENKEADTSTSAPPTNLFGSDPDESKDNDKMEE